MLDGGPRDVHRVALRAREEAGGHLRVLRIRHIDQIFGGLLEAAFAHVADHADDFRPVLAVVERDAPAQGTFVAPETPNYRLIDDRHARFIGTIAIVEISAARK